MQVPTLQRDIPSATLHFSRDVVASLSHDSSRTLLDWSHLHPRLPSTPSSSPSAAMELMRHLRQQSTLPLGLRANPLGRT